MYFLNKKQLIIYVSFCLTQGAMARNPVIYGVDNRLDTVESRSPLFQRLASSTAARISWDEISVSGNNAFIEGQNLISAVNACPEIRFAQQPALADCSGVLVAPDVIATAGHCMMSSASCSDYAWVFNYKVRNARQKNVTVRERDVYRCKEIITSQMTAINDYALVRLERTVKNAIPVKVSSSKPKVGTKVVSIGNPTGLPQKIADGARVLSVSRYEFKANLDTFEKASGSPVFNAENGDYLGVLVRGEKDYIKHPSKNCQIPNAIGDDGPGEEISSSTQFYHLLKNL